MCGGQGFEIVLMRWGDDGSEAVWVCTGSVGRDTGRRLEESLTYAEICALTVGFDGW